MKQVKTARGRIIDMAALAKSGEDIRAVSPGNVTMNGRGDELDKSGNVIKTVQAKSQAVRNTTASPEKTKLSHVPGNGKKKEAETTSTETKEPMVLKKTEKTREDGSRYLETEYDDGSMDVTELGE